MKLARTLVQNVRTTVAGVMFLALSALLYQHAITVDQAVLLLPVIGAYLAAVSKDGRP